MSTMNTSGKKLLKASAELDRIKREMSGELAKTRLRISDLKAERERLTHAPLSRADLEDALRADLALAGKEALPSVQRLAEEAQTRTTLRVEGSQDAALYHPLPSRFTPEILALLIPADQILAAIKPALDGLDYSRSGPPLAERRKRIAEIDGELSELEPQAAELAEALGQPANSAKPRPPGPKPGDTKEIYQGHDGHLYQPTFVRKQMPGDPNALTEGWEAVRVPAPARKKAA